MTLSQTAVNCTGRVALITPPTGLGVDLTIGAPGRGSERRMPLMCHTG